MPRVGGYRHLAALPAFFPRRVSAARVAAWRAPAALAGLWISLSAIHLWWLVRFRRGFPVDLDEAGYLWFSFVLHDDLRADGPGGLFHGFQHQGFFPPLLPTVTAVLELAAGAKQIIPSMGVQVLFFGVLLFASYGIGVRLLDRRGGLLTALVVATLPAITDFVRTYHMVIPSTATYAVATYALLASDRLRRRWWVVACGVALGLALLSRSMMLAFVPAVGLGAVWILIADRAGRERIVNLALGALAFVATALLWYGTSWHAILDYLLSFGYGAESARSPALSPASVDYWTHELTRTVSGSLYLPLAAAMTAALVLAAAAGLTASRSSGRRDALLAAMGRAARSDAIVPALVVFEGYVALSSTRNDGTGFVVPLLPSLVALVVLATLRLPWRASRVGLVTALAAVSVFNVAMKADVASGLSRDRAVRLPLWGPATVASGRGWIHGYLVSFAGYRLGPPTRWLPDRDRGWIPLYDRLAEYADGVRRRDPVIIVAGEEPLLNGSVLRLRGYQTGHPEPIFRQLDTDGRDSVRAYERWLRGERPDLLLTRNRDREQFPPRVTNRLVEVAARSSGLRLLARFPLPDGRELRVWGRREPRRGSAEASRADG
jgi:hypothetical protein